MLRPAVCVLATVLSAFPSAESIGQGVNLSLGGGTGDLNVDTRTAISNAISTDATFDPEIGVGYRFANNVAIEGSATTAFDLMTVPRALLRLP